MIFSQLEIDYLTSQRMARLATQQPNGTLQVNPVVFWYNAELETIDIGGRAMADTQKYRNVADNGRVAIVVDDVFSLRPWRVRGIEIRGPAQALADQEIPDEKAFLSPELIRIRPARVFTWGIDPEHVAMTRRSVTPTGVGR